MGWNCKFCGTHNEESDVKCILCDKLRSVAEYKESVPVSPKPRPATTRTTTTSGASTSPRPKTTTTTVDERSSSGAHTSRVAARATESSSRSHSANPDRKHKVAITILAILFFVSGQILQYIIYSCSRQVWLVDLIFGSVPLLFLIVSTFLCAISIAIICYNSCHLASNKEYVASWLFGIISSILFIFIPCFIGTIGIILFPIISMVCAQKICTDYVEETISKTFGIAIPIVLFVVGQIIQYFLFITEKTVFIMDNIIGETPVAVLIVSTILCAVSTVMTVINSYKIADDSAFAGNWSLSIIVGLLNVIIPSVFAFVGVIALGLITYFKCEIEEEKIPAVAIIMSFIAGQVLLYVPYVKTGNVFVLSNLINQTEAGSFNLLVFLIITTVIGFAASVIMSKVGFDLVAKDKEGSALISVIPFSVVMVICPSIVSILGLVYSVIILIFRKKDWYKKLAIPMIAILVLPVAIMIPVSGSLPIMENASTAKYVVELDKQGGVGGTDEVTVKLNSAMPSAKAPSKTGYTFDGYYDAISGGTQYYNGNMKSTKKWDREEDSKLYAHWIANQYKVIFDYNEGVGEIDNITVTFDSQYGLLPVPTKSGYIFDGWYYGDKKIDSNTKVSVANEHTLVAMWRIGTVTVYFNYGSGNGSTASKTVTYGSTYGTLPSATRTGYSFNGWYYHNTRITSSSIVQVAENHTLTAQYSIENYTITINASHVTVTVKRLDTNATITSGSSVPYNTKISIAYQPQSGYQNATCSPSGTYTVTGNVTIRASAEAIPDSCIAKGTEIMLANGSVALVEQIMPGDKVLSFDHIIGEYVESQVAYTYRSYGYVDSLTLFFSNNGKINLLNSGHGLYNITLQQYVLVSASTVTQYLGHEFYFTKYDEGRYIGLAAELSDYNISKEFVEYFDIVTEKTFNCVANGLLACSDTLVGVSNVFSFNENLQYDNSLMNDDIDKYGLYTYDEWKDYISKEDFNKFNGAIFKVAVAKGLITMDEVFSLLNDLTIFWNSI